MLEMNIGYTVQGVILAAGLCVAGAASAQESGLTSASPAEIQQTAGNITPVAVEGEDAGGNSSPKVDIPGAAKSPAPRMNWDSAAPQLDAFGNETVPIFNSTYSGR
jgi:hypothetical protein